jgi:hypothetical protein
MTDGSYNSNTLDSYMGRACVVWAQALFTEDFVGFLSPSSTLIKP